MEITLDSTSNGPSQQHSPDIQLLDLPSQQILITDYTASNDSTDTGTDATPSN
jgi:hypothetical protein